MARFKRRGKTQLSLLSLSGLIGLYSNQIAICSIKWSYCIDTFSGPSAIFLDTMAVFDIDRLHVSCESKRFVKGDSRTRSILRKIYYEECVWTHFLSKKCALKAFGVYLHGKLILGAPQNCVLHNMCVCVYTVCNKVSCFFTYVANKVSTQQKKTQCIYTYAPLHCGGCCCCGGGCCCNKPKKNNNNEQIK